MSLVSFMQRAMRRSARIAAGVLMIAVGQVLGSASGLTLAIVGIVTLAAGLAKFCLIGPLVGSTPKGALTGESCSRTFVFADHFKVPSSTTPSSPSHSNSGPANPQLEVVAALHSIHERRTLS